MKSLKKTRLANALLAATTGMSMLALSETASAQIDDELQSEVLVVPYYTVREGWTTLANLTNTTPYTVVVKVRYRESYNSRDVLDFNLIMSPNDVWTGWVAEGPNGPRLLTRDSTCTTPIFDTLPDGSRYADFSNLGYQGDGGPTDIDRTREGHFEFITMGQFYPGAEDEKHNSPGSWDDWSGPTITWSSGDPKFPTAYYAKHENGQPRNCEMVDSRFEATASVWDIDDIVDNGGFSDSLSSDGDPLAEADVRQAFNYWPEGAGDAGEEVLKGNFSLVNVANGIAAGAMAWALDEWSVHYNDEELMTAQQFPWFLEPTLYSEHTLWGWATDASRQLDVETQNNEWSTNPRTGAMTDWVVTFPTKEFHVDISEDDIYAGANPVRMVAQEDYDSDGCNKEGNGKWECDMWQESGEKDTFEEAFLAGGGLAWDDYCPDANHPYEGCEEGDQRADPGKSFESVFDGQSCDTVVYGLFDREETGIQGSGTSISPAPPQPTDSLCYETNVLSFQEDSVLGSALAVKVDTGVLPSEAASGWLRLQMSDACRFDQAVQDDKPYWGEYCYEELPAIGFAYKARDFGDPTRNFGQLMYNGAHDNMQCIDDFCI